MLRFSRKPDKIFTEILESSFELVIDTIEENCSDDNLDCFLPHAARNLSKETTIEVLRELIKHNRASGLWELNNYHYTLIYDILEMFCELMNEVAENSGEPILTLDRYKIREIDFERLIDLYFSDTDFLITPEAMAIMPAEVKKQLGIDEETWGVAMGMTVHPEELKIKLYEKGDFIPANPSPVYFRETSKKYPDYYISDNSND